MPSDAATPTPVASHTQRCVGCRYDLSSSDPDGRCPECGVPVRESLGALGSWSVWRLRQARWMVRLSCVFAVVAVASAVVNGLRWMHALGLESVLRAVENALGVAQVSALLAAAALACVVAVVGRSEGGSLHRVVPALVVGAVALIGGVFVVGALLAFGQSPLTDSWGVWPVVILNSAMTAGATALLLAPLLVMHALTTSGVVVGVRTRWITITIGLVVALAALGALRSVEFVAIGVSSDDPDSTDQFVFRVVLLTLVGTALVTHTAILVVSLQLHRAISTRLATIESARSGQTPALRP